MLRKHLAMPASFGLEDMASKRRDRPYHAARSKHCIKVKNSGDGAGDGIVRMTTVANLRARKRKLLERLEENADSNERDEIERQLALTDVALDYLGPTAGAGCRWRIRRRDRPVLFYRGGSARSLFSPAPARILRARSARDFPAGDQGAAAFEQEGWLWSSSPAVAHRKARPKAGASGRGSLWRSIA